MKREQKKALKNAARLLRGHAESLRGPCSNDEDGDFSCEDCPAGRAICLSEWQKLVDTADQLDAFEELR